MSPSDLDLLKYRGLRSAFVGPATLEHIRSAFCDAEPIGGTGPSLCDPSIDPNCGFATIDEAEILFELARLLELDGLGCWAEVGGLVGWTAAHLAASGAFVESFDSSWGGGDDGSPSRRRATENLSRCGLLNAGQERVRLRGQRSDSATCFAAGVFIDGDHSDPIPFDDAGRALAMTAWATSSAIVFHDAYGTPVIRAMARVLAASSDWRLRIYGTRHGLGVCLRGPAIDFPRHESALDQWKAQARAAEIAAAELSAAVAV